MFACAGLSMHNVPEGAVRELVEVLRIYKDGTDGLVDEGVYLRAMEALAPFAGKTNNG